MDDRRFDGFTRAIATGGSRRRLIKGLLGGLATLGSLSLDDDVRAARRPTPVSRPPRCSGSQTPCATGCCCPSGTEICGAECCPGGDYSVCCDNACCNGICYGEELCCPLGQVVCGGVCLPPGENCAEDGVCADTVLAGANDPAANFLVDDDLNVYVNGELVFTGTQALTPIALGALTNGDLLRVVASNTTAEDYCYVGYEYVPALTLYCRSTGTSQVVNPTAVDQLPGGCGHVFLDQTVPVTL